MVTNCNSSYLKFTLFILYTSIKLMYHRLEKQISTQSTIYNLSNKYFSQIRSDYLFYNGITDIHFQRSIMII